MKTIIRNIALTVITVFVSQGMAQTITICAGESTLVTALNNSGLSSPIYSINPGGITSNNATFTVAPSGNVVYTLFVTGTNSNSALVTTSNTVTILVQASGTSFSLSSPASFTLGCGSKSLCPVNITNINSLPNASASVSFSFLPPGSSTILTANQLASNSSTIINIPGTWSVVVKNQTTGCNTWSVMNISQNLTQPAIGNISTSQNPLTCSTSTTLIQASPNSTLQYKWLPSGILSNSLIVTSSSTIPTQSVAATLTLQVININNFCQSDTVITIYQNRYLPNAMITGLLYPTTNCPDSIILVNSSTKGTPSNYIFPTPAPVVGLLWEGPWPQTTVSLSTTYSVKTTGIYTMTAMDNNNGCTKTTTYNVVIAPTAAFIHTVTNGQVNFSNVSINTNTTTLYFWDFGDGNTSTLQNPSHTFISGGAHLVKLKVMNLGTLCIGMDSIIQSVNVSGIPCIANSGFAILPTNTAQVWNVVPSYPWNVTNATWNWGDGSISNTLYTSHQYSTAGMYNICLSVTVSCAATSSSCSSYSVYRSSQSAMIIEVNVLSPELETSATNFTPDEQIVWDIIPNPNAGEWKLAINNVLFEPIHIIIKDFTGRIMFVQSFYDTSNPILLQTSHLESGIYFVSMETSEQKTTKRMIVNH